MKYMSSRGKEKGLSFEEVLFSGYSSDGGLYFPELIPKLSAEQITQWAGLGYVDLVKELLRLYISESEIPTDDLDVIVEDCFRGRFDVPLASSCRSNTNATSSGIAEGIISLFAQL